ncbi:MAG TPA: DUF2169 domain-containing protein [Steroidobacteraceae bacterium]|jgi:hypothetical protein|nr:DUF2169 domain-containing protein [Steroidobacteraceae bacterium]
MLQLDNQTPFGASFALLPDRAGIDTLFVIVKATVNLRPKLALAPAQSPPGLVDEYYEDPDDSSLRQHSDMHIGKPGTDVLLVGCARAPRGEQAEGVMVTLNVAERGKRVMVVGDRTWLSDGTPSVPQPFEAIPLVWERAFGGTDSSNPEQVLAEERNPVGVGFRGRRDPEWMVGQPVPNLENPDAPLNTWNETPAPACFAPIAPAWLPRRQYAGTYDAVWQRTRAPYLPDDFDPRFFHSACPELCFDRFLRGGEIAEIRGATDDAPLTFTVPSVRPAIEVSVAGQMGEPEPNLETLMFEPDYNRASMTWRAALPCDRKALKVEKITVRVRRSRGAAR